MRLPKASAPSTPLFVPCADALDYLQKSGSLTRRHWIYRGHGQSNFTPSEDDPYFLRSSLWRFLRTHSAKIIKPSWYPRERMSVERFKQTAHLHLTHLPAANDIIEWLALMQHYGAPTRLLDFTLNPAVALFFAVRDATPNAEPWSVHALHIDTLRGKT